MFCQCSYYAAILKPDKIEAFRKKWPEDDLQAKRVNNLEANLHAHDPAMLICDDHGDTERLAMTENFINGVKERKP